MGRISLNKPPNWLSRALDFISSQTPGDLDTLISPVIETMQGGLAHAVDEYFRLDGSLVASAATTIGLDPNHAYLVRFSALNAGTAIVQFSAQLLHPVALAGPVLVALGIPVGTTFGWFSTNQAGTVGLGGGNQFIYVPPGWGLLLSIGQFTTSVGNVQIHTCRVPAGTRPW